jgi:hypothetical protein
VLPLTVELVRRSLWGGSSKVSGFVDYKVTPVKLLMLDPVLTLTNGQIAGNPDNHWLVWGPFLHVKISSPTNS